MTMFKSIRHIILISIISSVAAECVAPDPESGMTLEFYSETNCESDPKRPTDHQIYSEERIWELAGGFVEHDCHCFPISPLIHTASCVFSPGEQKTATIILWAGARCEKDSYDNNILTPGEPYLNPKVPSEIRLRSAQICIWTDHDEEHAPVQPEPPAHHVSKEKPHRPSLKVLPGGQTTKTKPTDRKTGHLKPVNKKPHVSSGKKKTLVKSVEHAGENVVKGLAGGLEGAAAGWLGLGGELGAATGVGAPAGEAVAVAFGLAA
ncbi:hypothetical protein BJ138DRAFT_1145488 [Hygrophoropsis aurantiaca]|uniref:Uncharacterized protein n=1 Tax=Hygrophoropsis aurantiaca TaxID=72124 RepID=A0ACB8AJQ1_9AGAM|nr:hypothetical protein BJ138DRAFT_1145488 [Hygrophoropsis aurantiaca]